jgi:hypothetical protein
LKYSVQGTRCQTASFNFPSTTGAAGLKTTVYCLGVDNRSFLSENFDCEKAKKLVNNKKKHRKDMF